jgi:MazG family protein
MTPISHDTPPEESTGSRFERLVDVMRTLRSPQGCPWDREQTIQSLSHFVLEEAYEVVDAIERGDLGALREEIGDHIFEGVFLAQIASESGAFKIADALQTVADKLIRRHPHVFNDEGEVHDAASKERAPSADAALRRWNTLKAQERANTGHVHSLLAGVPKSLPALLRAFKLGKRAADVGFDWERARDVLGKIEEEAGELRQAIASQPADRAQEERPTGLGAPSRGWGPAPLIAEEELGDLLFAVANLARKLDIEPEAALRRANDKFTRRFEELERRFAERGRPIQDSSLEEMEEEWQRIKSAERCQAP